MKNQITGTNNFIRHLKRIGTSFALSLFIAIVTLSVFAQDGKAANSPRAFQPFKVIELEQVRYNPVLDYGYLKPKKGYKLLVVFFQGLTPGSKIRVTDTKWSLEFPKGRAEAFAFGVYLDPRIGPVKVLGKLKDVLVYRSGGSKPLWALVYTVPLSVTEITLKSPEGKGQVLSVEEKWLPEKENEVADFDVAELEFELKDENLDPLAKPKPLRITPR